MGANLTRRRAILNILCVTEAGHIKVFSVALHLITTVAGLMEAQATLAKDGLAALCAVFAVKGYFETTRQRAVWDLVSFALSRSLQSTFQMIRWFWGVSKQGIRSVIAHGPQTHFGNRHRMQCSWLSN